MLTAIAVLFSTLIALAQTEPQTQPVPAAKTEKAEKKDKTDKIKHAEQRSNGAAFSGKGKGGDKDQVEKDKAKPKKDKKKKKNKGKKAKKDKKQDGSGSGADEGNPDAQTPSDKWEQKPAQEEKTPATRQAGDKSTDGSIIKKERKSRG